MATDNNTPSDDGASPNMRRRAFAAAYLRLGNATKAAIEAGYSPKTAQQAGSRLLRDAVVLAMLAQLGGNSAAAAPLPAKPAKAPKPPKEQKPRKAKPAPEPAPAPAAEPAPAPAPAMAQMLLSRRGVPDPDQPALATSPTEDAFITEYLRNGMNATAAWVFVHPGVPPGRANAVAWKVLRRPRVVQRLAAERARMAAKHEMSRDQLLAEFLAIVRADPNELVQMRRVACTDCWPHAEKGGRWTGPDPECEECHGEGDAVPWIADTRNLSPEARALFAGIKVTSNGVQVLMHDKLAALTNIGRILGAFEADNRQKATPMVDAVAQFLGQLHGGAGRLKYVERVK